MKTKEPIAIMTQTAWSSVDIVGLTDEHVEVKYSYMSEQGKKSSPIAKREIVYRRPDWSNEEEPCFYFKGCWYWLSEFMKVDEE